MIWEDYRAISYKRRTLILGTDQTVNACPKMKGCEMSDFNAKQSRTKRPCPLWVDAFQRDTQHLEADEVGAYMLILMAMWTRESCDLPDNNTRLARVSRVSLRLWKSRVGPVIREFLTADNGFVISQRLRKEAGFVERHVTHQSNRKVDKKSGKPLKNNKPPSTTDTTTDNPRYYPTQQPNNLHKDKDKDKSSSSSSSFEADFYQRFLKAHPKPNDSATGEDLFAALVKAGTDPEQIIASAAVYAEKAKTFSSPNFIQQSDNFLSEDNGKWRANLPPKKHSQDEVLDSQAKRINGDGFIPANQYSETAKEKLVTTGRVTRQRMIERTGS